jgi:branched-chain amino acid transport system substrate-binding protein
MALKGIQLALTQINDSALVRGRRLELLPMDDSASGSRAAVVARRFVENADVVGVVGHVTSGAMVAAAKVYDGNIAAIATSATSPELTGISPWVFRVSSSDAINGGELARFASRLGHRRAAIIYENDSYGRGLADAFRRAFNGEIVSMDPIDVDLVDAEPYITHYKRRAPDIVFVVSRDASGFALLREARRQRLGVDFIGGDGWNGVVTDTALAEGVYIGTTFVPDDPRPHVRRFVREFRARYGVTPDMDAAAGYDAMRLMASAIAAAGPSRSAIRRHLASLHDGTPHQGLTGRIRFGKDGDPVETPYRVARASRGSLHLADQ